MNAPQYQIIKHEGSRFVTAFIPGHPPQVAGEDHPQFQTIIDTLLAGPAERQDWPEYHQSLVDLFDLSLAVATKFEGLSDRVSVCAGRVYFDGDEVDNSLTEHIVRAYQEGANFLPLVKLYENIAQNPNDHSRHQLFDWLKARDFAITSDGLIIAYKGVQQLADRQFASHNSGRALVNGEPREGQITQTFGDVVTMPRNDVAHNPAASCSTGLHVGTYEYAQQWARGGALLAVWVNPRDVVSVPTSDNGDKIRVCRYVVAGRALSEVKSAVQL